MEVDWEEEDPMVLDRISGSIPFIAPPNSLQQPLAAETTSPPSSTEKKQTVTLRGLFGPNGPALPVQGCQEALETLGRAISDGLAVLKAPHDGDAVMDSALSYLQSRGVVPDHHEQGILELSQERPEELAALGLTADQFALSPKEARVLDTAYIPFLSRLVDSSAHFNVEKVLIMLKVFARYWQHTGKRYQLLVVTKVSPHKLDAQIFSTQEHPNETIFLFRDLEYNGCFGDAPSYRETWMPITLPKSAPRPAHELDSLGRPLNQSVDRTPKAQQPKSAKRAAVSSPAPAPAPGSDHPRERAKPQHSGINTTAYRGMTPSEVFKKVQDELADGTLHPDGVAGERLLLFAVAYSNAAIRDLLIPYNEQYNQTVASSNNVYNGRILPAIKHSLHPGESFDKAKAEFDEARNANDLITTSALRGAATGVGNTTKTRSKVTRKRKRGTGPVEAKEDELEQELSDEDMGGKVTVAATPATRKTRGARPRTSYRVFAGEDSEDEEMEEADSSEQDERARAIRKRAMMNDEEDDDEDGEFQLDT